ncbi:MAG: septal ring lytic transglycosylase RlpA family protein [Ignavibacteriaceae bacterium]|nr:septal ring lytic transglycosylase RlpA family protein [Ignavibacteriaceae bacterium]
MKFIPHILLVLILIGCSSTPRFTNESDSDGSRIKYPTGTTIFNGTASYYADEFHGRKTASGEIYDMNKLTAAHRNFPFGTVVKVTNLKNNKIVKVRINDRMPDFKNRIIDLSYGAAKEIDMIRDGIVEVRIEVIEWGK